MKPSKQFVKFRSAPEIIRLASKAHEAWIEPDAFLRYFPALQWIKRNANHETRILEVGSGDFGISTYTSAPIVKTDLAFSKAKNADQKVIANAAFLPFRHNAFDLVLAVDLLEHVPHSQRFAIILELIRTSKQSAIIVFPSGEKALESDKNIMNQFRKRAKRPLPILEAHLEFSFPNSSEVREWISELQKSGFKCRSENSFNLFWRKQLAMGWLQKNKCARFLAERIIQSSLLRNLINFGNCYRQFLLIEKAEAHNNR